MKHTWQLVSLLVVAGAAAATAQRPMRAHAPAPHMGSSAQPSHEPETRGMGSAEHAKSFSGIAKRLNTTPDALEQAYTTARGDNPKLTRGQFIAANVLAHNLGAKNPAITTDAIVAGLKSGKSIGQTLKSLGVTDKEAKEAERAADKEAKEAEQDSDKPADKDQKGQ